MAKDEKSIVVGGQRYGSIEEMPLEVRRVYERALAARASAREDNRVKILYEGKQYENLDSMPSDVRRRYDHEQASMETFRDFSVDSTQPRTVTPRSRNTTRGGSVRALQQYKWLLIVVGVIVLGVIGWFIGRALI